MLNWRKILATSNLRVTTLPRDGLAWALGRRKLYRVRGYSMTPTLQPGDLVLVKAIPKPSELVQRLVVAHHPTSGGIVIKRVRSIGDKAAYLGSDNPGEGTDSRHFGSILFSELIGVVVQTLRV